MAKNKRLKSAEPALIGIENWETADKLLGRIADLEAGIEAREQKATAEVDRIKADLAAEVKPIREATAHARRSIEAFATARRADFGKAKSRSLANGKIGWRKSTKTEPTSETLELIKQIFSAAKAKILIKVSEKVDRTALARLTDEQLACVGARREVKEVFFVEPDSVEAAEY